MLGFKGYPRIEGAFLLLELPSPPSFSGIYYNIIWDRNFVFEESGSANCDSIL